MKKDGFTLIELLAVIVILAIIALIATPLILDVIDDAKKGAFKNSAYGIIEAAELSYTDDVIRDKRNATIFTYRDGVEIPNIEGKKLEYKGERPKEGIVSITPSGEIAFALHNGKYCVIKRYDSQDVVLEEKPANECQLELVSSGRFVATYGGSDDGQTEDGGEGFRSVKMLPDGYIAVGDSDATDGDLEGLNKGQSDGTIVKYDINGNVVWKKNFGGLGYDRFEDIIVVLDGYIALGGTESTDGDLEGLNVQSADGIAVKYDINGNVVWKKKYGGNSVDAISSGKVIDDGYIVIGASDSMDFINLSTQNGDALIMKLDFDGNIIWKRNYGGSNHDVSSSVEVLSDGYVFGGWTLSTDGPFSETGKSEENAFICKIDLEGNIVWSKVFGGTGTEGFHNIIKVTDGFLAVGESNSRNVDLTGLNKGMIDGIVVKYDFNGNLLWKKNFGGSWSDQFYGVTEVLGGYLVAGLSNSANSDMVGVRKGVITAVIVKYDYDGNIVWKQGFGGSLAEAAACIDSFGDGYVIVGIGMSNDGDLKGLNKGNSDAFIAKR